jgi:hypothetical protein
MHLPTGEFGEIADDDDDDGGGAAVGGASGGEDGGDDNGLVLELIELQELK